MLGNRLEVMRNKKGLSQAEIARRANVSRSLYNKYERANVRPSDDILIALAKELDTSLEYLIKGIEEPPDGKYPNPITNEDLKFALFGDAKDEITEDDMDDVRTFAQFVAERKRKKNEKSDRHL